MNSLFWNELSEMTCTNVTKLLYRFNPKQEKPTSHLFIKLKQITNLTNQRYNLILLNTRSLQWVKDPSSEIYMAQLKLTLNLASS